MNWYQSQTANENGPDPNAVVSTGGDQALFDDRFALGSPASYPSYSSPFSRYDGSHNSPFTPDTHALQDGSPFSLTTSDTVPTSTAFHAEAFPLPNTILMSSDGVMFYVEDQTILDRCPTAFQSYLSAPLSAARFRQQIIQLDTPSAELNVILHAVYRTSSAVHSPDTTTLIYAVDRMPAYDISPEAIIRPDTKLHDLLLSHAPLHPLEIYALAARHNLSSLAITVSSYLLSYDLSTITDEMAERIGATYLKRLFVLHFQRHAALKEILLHPLHPHPPTDECGLKDQEKLMRAWAMVSAHFVWDAHPDLSSSHIRNASHSLLESLTCELCRKALEDKMKNAAILWVNVKRTI